MKPHSRARPVVLCGVVCGLIAVSCGGSDSSAAITTTAAVGTISDAAVQVVANGCTHVETHGAGLMVAPGRIATVAHVVAGAKTVEVRGVLGAADATVVYFDPILDVAVLKVDSTVATPIPIGAASPGDEGTVIVYRDDAPVELTAGVQRLVNIRTADIYGEGKHVRPGYELTLDIQAGDSGAVVVIDDKAVALVWATSRQAESRAWAMRTSLIADHLSADTPVDNGQCV
jgi:S1-C subfamily serine protease